MKIYVAGNEVERARKVMDRLTAAGHSITYDWIATLDKGSVKEVADREVEAVREADLLVYLWNENQESAKYEAGMAMGLLKPLVVSTTHIAHFFQLDNVHQIMSDDDILRKIEELATA